MRKNFNVYLKRTVWKYMCCSNFELALPKLLWVSEICGTSVYVGAELSVCSEIRFLDAFYRVIKKSLCTGRLQYGELQVMFKVSPASLQTFIDTPNCVLEARVQFSTVHIPNAFCDGHFFACFLYCNHQVHGEFLITLYILLLLFWYILVVTFYTNILLACFCRSF
jgi:hypothetical protein